jgi:hypothetical protein
MGMATSRSSHHQVPQHFDDGEMINRGGHSFLRTTTILNKDYNDGKLLLRLYCQAPPLDRQPEVRE